MHTNGGGGERAPMLEYEVEKLDNSQSKNVEASWKNRLINDYKNNKKEKNVGEPVSEYHNTFFTKLLSKPLEKEVFEEVKDELYCKKENFKQAKFLKLMENSLKQNFYCNFHNILILNKYIPRGEMRHAIFKLEKLMCNLVKIDNLEEFNINSFDKMNLEARNIRINIFKYILFYKKVDTEAEKRLLDSVGSLPFFKVFKALSNSDSNKFAEKLNSYVDSIKADSLNTQAELKSLLTADFNILILRTLLSEKKEFFKSLVEYSDIDINRFYQTRRGVKPEVSLIAYIVEKGYHELLQMISGKKINTEFKNENGKHLTLLSWCAKGFSYEKECIRYSNLSVNHDKCIDILLKILKNTVNPSTDQNLMADIVKLNYDNAALKILGKFKLSSTFLKEVNTRILEKFLNKCVMKSNKGFLVNYDFFNVSLENQQNASDIMNYIRSSRMKTLFTHPVLSNYIEYKHDRLNSWNMLNFYIYIVCVALILISFTFPKLIFLMFITIGFFVLRIICRIHFGCNTGWRIHSFLSTLTEVAVVILLILTFLREGYKFYFSLSIILVMIDMSLFRAVVFPLQLDNYTLMLESVSIVTLKVLGIFSWILILFSVIFHNIFINDRKEGKEGEGQGFNDFDNFWTSFVKTTRMVTGESDAGEMNFSEMWNFAFFLYFLLPSISISYLINALAIVDVKELHDNVDLNNLMAKWDNVNKYETFQSKPNWLRKPLNYFLKEERNRDFSKVLYRQTKIRFPSLRNILRCYYENDDYQDSECEPVVKSPSKSEKHPEEIFIEKNRMEDLKRVARSNDMQSLHSDNDIKISNIEKTMDQLKQSSVNLSDQLRSVMEQIKELKKLMEK